MTDLIKYEIEGAICLLTLNRPEKLNALNYATNDKLLEYWIQSKTTQPSGPLFSQAQVIARFLPVVISTNSLEALKLAWTLPSKSFASAARR